MLPSWAIPAARAGDRDDAAFQLYLRGAVKKFGDRLPVDVVAVFLGNGPAHADECAFDLGLVRAFA